MELLDWRKICIFNKEVKDEAKGLLVLYEKTGEEYDIKHSFDAKTRDRIAAYLKKTRATNKPCEVRIYNVTEEDKLDYAFVCLCSAGLKKDDPKNEITKKENKEETKNETKEEINGDDPKTSPTNNPDDELVVEKVRKAVSRGMSALKAISVRDIYLSVTFYPQEMAIGALLSSYSYDLLKRGSKSNLRVSPSQSNSEYERGEMLAMHQNFARFLADTPANLMTPALFCEYALDLLLHSKNVLVEVFEKEYMVQNKMDLFLSVTEGSEQPPKLLVVKYSGSSEKKTHLSLVGKGITFDSGGISLKPSARMGEMKADMMGGASVLAAVGMAAATEAKINITVTVPLCENMPSGKATKPGDVKIGMSGISIEVDNTDAEGRLILGDALTHAQREDVSYLINVATLTGAMGVALGNVYMGLFCNSEAFSSLIVEAGRKCDDLVWRMPLSKKYRVQMDSDVADMKNAGGRGGGSCTAAIFLNEFIKSDVKWAHLDIASTMIGAYNSDLNGKGMSGKPVRLLFEVIENIEKEVKK